MSDVVEQDDATAVELTAVKLLASREHSRYELRRKLVARHPDGALVDAVLDDLTDQRLLDDERFTESYVAQRSRKGYGPVRIRAELAERGIEGSLVECWLESAGDRWAELLADVAHRKFGDAPAEDMRALSKRGRFLEQRGFPVGLIRRYLDDVKAF